MYALSRSAKFKVCFESAKIEIHWDITQHTYAEAVENDANKDLWQGPACPVRRTRPADLELGVYCKQFAPPSTRTRRVHAGFGLPRFSTTTDRRSTTLIGKQGNREGEPDALSESHLL